MIERLSPETESRMEDFLEYYTKPEQKTEVAEESGIRETRMHFEKDIVCITCGRKSTIKISKIRVKNMQEAVRKMAKMKQCGLCANNINKDELR